MTDTCEITGDYFSVEKKVSICSQCNLIAVCVKQLRYERDFNVRFFHVPSGALSTHCSLFLHFLFTFFHSSGLFLLECICLSFSSAFMMAFQYVGRSNLEWASASLNVVTRPPSLHLLLRLPFSPFLVPSAYSEASDSNVRHTL